MIDKQVIQLILICLVGTDDSAMGKNRSARGRPRLQAGNHDTLSHTASAYHEVLNNNCYRKRYWPCNLGFLATFYHEKGCNLYISFNMR